MLLLEDLHWSDSATIELVSMLARRRDPSRLLLLATYRPADVAAAEAHPLRWLKPELQLHGYCEEIPLDFLTPADVAQYLARRFPGHALPSDLAVLLHRSTEGSPLFLVNTVDYLIGQGRLRETDGRWQLTGAVEEVTTRVPETLGQLVDEQVARLPVQEQAVLVAASVAGSEFSTAAVAVTAGIDPQQAELRCEALARRGQFLRAVGVGEWPDGTVTARYAFIHALYQQVLYGRVPICARAGLHRRTAERVEQGYGVRSGKIAGELAVHFERGRDLDRAAEYRGRAGEHALQQHAYREAADHAGRGLSALEALPASRERAQRELCLRVTLGAALTATHGYAAPDVADTYARAWELCGQVGETPALLPVLRGVGRFYVVRGQFDVARDVGTQLLALAKTGRDPAPLLMAHNALGVASLWAGDFEGALEHLDRGIELYQSNERDPSPVSVFRLVPPGVTCAIHAALALWALGYPDRSVARAREALALARFLGHPFSVSYACHLAAGLHQWRREAAPMQALEDEALAHDIEHGFELLLAAGLVQRGRLLAEQGEGAAALDQMREGVARHREVGAAALIPASLVMVAEVYQKLDRPADGLSAVTEGLAVARSCGQHYWEAELHRLAGVLTFQIGASAHVGEAEAHLDRSIQIARRQRAKSLELRAVTSLSRLWAGQGKVSEARARLADVYGWFTEGLDTADLTDARALLEELREQAEPSPERDRGQEPA